MYSTGSPCHLISKHIGPRTRGKKCTLAASNPCYAMDRHADGSVITLNEHAQQLDNQAALSNFV